MQAQPHLLDPGAGAAYFLVDVLGPAPGDDLRAVLPIRSIAEPVGSTPVTAAAARTGHLPGDRGAVPRGQRDRLQSDRRYRHRYPPRPRPAPTGAGLLPCQRVHRGGDRGERRAPDPGVARTAGEPLRHPGLTTARPWMASTSRQGRPRTGPGGFVSRSGSSGDRAGDRAAAPRTARERSAYVPSWPRGPPRLTRPVRTCKATVR